MKRLIDQIYNPETGTYYKVTFDGQISSDIKAFHNAGYSGKSITVAILDTGILTHHPLLKDNIVGEVSFNRESPEDYNGHGTFAALELVEYAPSVKILNVKVLDRYKNGFEEDIVKGLRWAVENHASIISISAGVKRKEKCDGRCVICKEIESIKKEHDITIFAAAGNEKNAFFCPASSQYVNSCGVTNYEGTAPADYCGNGAQLFVNPKIRLTPIG